MKSYPHFTVGLKDNSIYNATVEQVLPVNRQVYVLPTEWGEPGVPVWCPSYSVAVKRVGAKTFDPTSDYFSHQAYFLNEIFKDNGAYLVRAIDDTADAANIILEAHVELDAEVPVYQIDEVEGSDTYGQRLKDLDPDSDTFGEYIVETEVDGVTPVTELGVKIEYKTRVATSGELTAGLENLTAVTDGETGITVYPIMAFVASYPGAYGNDLTFRLFYDKNKNDVNSISKYQSVFNSLAVGKYTTSSNVENVLDRFDRVAVPFTADPTVVDPETKISQGMEHQLEFAYETEDGMLLPYTIYTYDSLEKIGDKIVLYETYGSLCAGDLGFATTDIQYQEDGTTPVAGKNGEANVVAMPGYMVNVLSGTNVDGVPYDHVDIVGRTSTATADTVLLAEDNNVSLTAGTDGADLSDNFQDQAMYRFVTGAMNSDAINDRARYPFTHIIDVGYSITTKFAMIDFMDTVEDAMVIVSTQVLKDSTWATGSSATISINDQATDVANGIVLREHALLMRESIELGTGACRCSIYAHTGYPVSTTYNKPLPYTLWSAVKYAQGGNLPSANGTEPRGWPNSYVTIFKDINWRNVKGSNQEMVWNEGINYCQTADSARWFFPALRTVYREETSVLVDEWVVSDIVYVKHLCRDIWGKFSGRNDPAAALDAETEQYTNTGLVNLFSGKYTPEVSVYRTTEDLNLGYRRHAAISLTIPGTQRVIDFVLNANREGYTAGGE